jgi:predicted esterase
MKLLQFQKLILIQIFQIYCSFIANGQSQISSAPLETPIRFQVEIPTNHPDSKQRLLYEKDWGVLILPKNYKPEGKPVPLVIGCHGGGGTVSSTGSQTESYDLYKYLVSSGYAVMDMAGMPESYSTRLKIDHYRCEGSFIAIRAYEEGYKWIIKNYNIDPNGCYITGGSNGGLTAANLVSISTIPVICQAGMSPLLSIKEQAWNITGGAISGGEFPAYQNRANIIRIFEMQNIKTMDELLNAKYENEKVGNFDPFKYEVTFDDNRMVKKNRCPVKIWHPVDDPILSIDFSRKFINTLNNAGVKSQLVEMPGGGHAPESYGQTLGYFKYQGNKFVLKPYVYELALWFGEYSGINPIYDTIESR